MTPRLLMLVANVPAERGASKTLNPPCSYRTKPRFVCSRIEIVSRDSAVVADAGNVGIACVWNLENGDDVVWVPHKTNGCTWMNPCCIPRWHPCKQTSTAGVSGARFRHRHSSGHRPETVYPL